MTNPSDPTLSDPGAERFSAGEDVLSIISGVQSELDRLKNAQRKQAEDQAALDTLRAELDERRRDLENHAAELEALRDEMDRRGADLDTRTAALEEAQASLEEARRNAAEESEALGQRRRELDDECAGLNVARSEADAALTRASELAQQTEARVSEIEAQRTARAAELDEREQTLRASEADLAGKQEELDAAAARLAEESAAVHQQQARLKEKQQSFEDSVARREAEHDERERALAADRTAVDQASRHAESIRRELEREREQLRKDQEEIEAEQQRLEQQRAHVVDLQARLEHATSEHTDQSTAIAELESRIESLTRELDAARAGADDRSGLREEAESLRRELESASAERDAQARRAESAQERITALEADVAAKPRTGAAPSEMLQRMQDELDKRERAVRALADKLHTAQEEIDALRDQPAAASPFPPGVDPALRLDRLRRLRRAVHAQSQRIVRAKDALVSRQDEAERIIGQRKALAAARAQLAERERQINARAGRNRGMVALFLGVLATLGLGAMSWAVANRAAPATYLADATIVADDTSGDLTDEQLSAWTDGMAALIDDPRLIDVAAGRMRRRGLLEYGSPGPLAARLASDLDVASPRPGAVTLTLRAPGADRATRVLDTFIASLISVANDARARRADGASTALSEAPSADPTPIDDQRLVYAGIGWGASTGVLLLLSLIVWVRLSAARKRFERDADGAVA